MAADMRIICLCRIHPCYRNIYEIDIRSSITLKMKLFNLTRHFLFIILTYKVTHTENDGKVRIWLSGLVYKL